MSGNTDGVSPAGANPGESSGVIIPVTVGMTATTTAAPAIETMPPMPPPPTFGFSARTIDPIVEEDDFPTRATVLADGSTLASARSLTPRALDFGSTPPVGTGGAGASGTRLPGFSSRDHGQPVEPRNVTPEQALQLLADAGYVISSPAAGPGSTSRSTPAMIRETPQPASDVSPLAALFQPTAPTQPTVTPVRPAVSTVVTTTVGSSANTMANVSPADARSILMGLLAKAAPESLASAASQPEMQEHMLENWYASMSGGKIKKRPDIARAATPFTREISGHHLDAAIPTPLSLGTYDGTSDPDDFMQDFEHHITSQVWDNVRACLMFPGQLRAGARKWFNELPVNSVSSFADLKIKFLRKYASHRGQALTHIDLHSVYQKPREQLTAYIDRFTAVCAKISNLAESHMVSCFIVGICLDRHSSLVARLRRKVPDTYDEAVERVRDYIREQDANIAARIRNKSHDGGSNGGNDNGDDGAGQGSFGQSGKGNGRNNQGRNNHGKSQKGRDSNQGGGSKPYDRPFGKRFSPEDDALYRSLTKTPKDILATEEVCQTFDPPQPMNKRYVVNNGKYCAFHEEIGHDIDECKALKRVILEKVKSGELAHLKPAQRSDSGKTFAWQNRDVKPETRIP